MTVVATPVAQRADARRNREAILEAALDVLARRPDAGLAEVAKASGLTRTTVYAHFASREELVEALVRRAVDEAAGRMDAGEPGRGPADEALLRLAAASWQQVAAHADLLATVAETLGARADELHAPVHDRVRALVRRGRRDGTFRRDVPEAWLVATYLALVHAAGHQVASGAMRAPDAERALGPTLLGAFGVAR